MAAELADAARGQDNVRGPAAADDILCPMCQTSLAGLGRAYGRVYHGMQCVQQMNETLGTPVKEPFDFKDSWHSAKCEAACSVVKTWCAWYGPCACVGRALERGWWEYEEGGVCGASMSYWKGCDCT